MLRTVVALAFSVTMLGGCAATQTADRDEPKPPTTRDWDTFVPTEEGNIYIGGQPSEQALDAFAASGGAVVINLRTEDEMAFMPYYDGAVAARGLTYHHLPTTGSAMGPEHYALVAAALRDAGDRPVLLHCGSGGRATYAWAMKKIETEHLSGDEAAAWCASRRDGKNWETGDAMLRAFAEQQGAE